MGKQPLGAAKFKIRQGRKENLQKRLVIEKIDHHKLDLQKVGLKNSGRKEGVKNWAQLADTQRYRDEWLSIKLSVLH